MTENGTPTPTFPNGTRVARVDDGATGTVVKTELVGAIEIVGVRYDEGDRYGNRAGDVLFGDAANFRPVVEDASAESLDDIQDASAESLDDIQRSLVAMRRMRDRMNGRIDALSHAIASAEADERIARMSAPDASLVPDVEPDPADSPTWCEVCNEDHGDELDEDDPAAVADEETIERARAELVAHLTLADVREMLAMRVQLAEQAWQALQHGTRGERWASARTRLAHAQNTLSDFDEIVARRMKGM